MFIIFLVRDSSLTKDVFPFYGLFKMSKRAIVENFSLQLGIFSCFHFFRLFSALSLNMISVIFFNLVETILKFRLISNLFACFVKIIPINPYF